MPATTTANGTPITLALSQLPPDFSLDKLYFHLKQQDPLLDYASFSTQIDTLNPELNTTQQNFLKSAGVSALQKYLAGKDIDPEIHLPAAAATEPGIAEAIRRKEQSPGTLAALAGSAGALLAQLNPLAISSAQAATHSDEMPQAPKAGTPPKSLPGLDVLFKPLIEQGRYDPPLHPVPDTGKPAVTPGAPQPEAMPSSIPSIVRDRSKEIEALRQSLRNPPPPADIELLPYLPDGKDDIEKLPFWMDGLQDSLTPAPHMLNATEPAQKTPAQSAGTTEPASPDHSSADPALEELIRQVSGPHTTLSRSKRYKEENKLLQGALIELGYLKPKPNDLHPLDGYLGDNTHEAVIAFQEDMQKTNPDFAVDGKVGKDTWDALKKQLEGRRGVVRESSLGDLAPPPLASIPPRDNGNAIT